MTVSQICLFFFFFFMIWTILRSVGPIVSRMPLHWNLMFFLRLDLRVMDLGEEDHRWSAIFISWDQGLWLWMLPSSTWLRSCLWGFSAIKFLFHLPFHTIVFGRKSLSATHTCFFFLSKMDQDACFWMKQISRLSQGMKDQIHEVYQKGNASIQACTWFFCSWQVGLIVTI